MQNFNITNYKITPLQLAEIESHLELASFILNSESIPNWEDLNTACRQICDARESLKMIREKTVQSALTHETVYGENQFARV